MLVYCIPYQTDGVKLEAHYGRKSGKDELLIKVAHEAGKELLLEDQLSPAILNNDQMLC